MRLTSGVVGVVGASCTAALLKQRPAWRVSKGDPSRRIIISSSHCRALLREAEALTEPALKLGKPTGTLARSGG